mgnify:CR=1 FL=1
MPLREHLVELRRRLVLAAVDVLVVVRRNRKRTMMTKREVKDVKPTHSDVGAEVTAGTGRGSVGFGSVLGSVWGGIGLGATFAATGSAGRVSGRRIGASAPSSSRPPPGTAGVPSRSGA